MKKREKKTTTKRSLFSVFVGAAAAALSSGTHSTLSSIEIALSRSIRIEWKKKLQHRTHIQRMHDPTTVE